MRCFVGLKLLGGAFSLYAGWLPPFFSMFRPLVKNGATRRRLPPGTEKKWRDRENQPSSNLQQWRDR